MARKKARKVPAKKKAPARKASASRSKTRARTARGPAWKPEGVQDVIPSLVSRNANSAIEFYKAAFGAKEEMRMMSPDGRAVWHAELRIGDAIFFINDAMPGGPNEAPGPAHKPTSSVQLYVPDVDAVWARALEAGASVAMPLQDQFWGDRMGVLVDPFGQPWGLSTRVRAMTMDEMRKAGEEFAKQFARHQQSGGQETPPASGAQ